MRLKHLLLVWGHLSSQDFFVWWILYDSTRRFLPIKSWQVYSNPTQGDGDNSLRGSFQRLRPRIAQHHSLHATHSISKPIRKLLFSRRSWRGVPNSFALLLALKSRGVYLKTIPPCVGVPGVCHQSVTESPLPTLPHSLSWRKGRPAGCPPLTLSYPSKNVNPLQKRNCKEILCRGSKNRGERLWGMKCGGRAGCAHCLT